MNEEKFSNNPDFFYSYTAPEGVLVHNILRDYITEYLLEIQFN